ncbi:MAG: hypothetical protein WAZ98_03775 [Cyclobacteriaceae bacterium]
MRPSSFNHRQKYQHMVNKRYQRDLLLLCIAVTGSICGLITITMLSPVILNHIDNVAPEIVTLFIVTISCLMFFIKYARK